MLEPIFKNYPEVKEEIYSGEGIKKMKAYKSILKIDELNKFRDDFFSQRLQTQGLIWKQIRHACLLDATRAQNMIEALKLTPVNGCMNLLVDPNGFYFAIPNYCINDPYLEKVFVNADEKRKPNSIKFKLCNVYNVNEKNELEVDDNITVLDLKILYTDNKKPLINPYDLRMFYGGVELKDDFFLYQHEIKSCCTVNVMKRPV